MRTNDLLDEIEQLIKKSEHVLKDPEFYIKEYFSNLKSEIDLIRENSLKMINDNYFRILSELEEEEKK